MTASNVIPLHSETVVLIPLDKLQGPLWNSRTEKKDKEQLKTDGAALAALAESLRVDGQKTPISVTGPDDEGNYTTVFGDRRRRAAISIGWTEIRCIVKTSAGTSDAEENIIENLQRSDLTTFERARSLAYLVDHGKNQAQASLSTGITKGHVSKLLTAYKGLPAPVLSDWEKDHPAADYAVLYEIASKQKTDEEKVKAWDGHVKAFVKARERATACKHDWDAKDKCKKCGETKGSTNAGYPVSQKALKLLLSVVKGKAMPDSETVGKADLRQTLDFIVKGRKTVPDWMQDFIPKEETDEEDGEDEK
jgi:ParB/RepB/Spo0J family partition protein